MCLTILKNTNKFVAESNILVYKCLDCEDDKYCTPFQYVPIYFNNGKTELEVKNFTYSHHIDILHISNTVNQGIHAYYVYNETKEVCKAFGYCCGTKTHYAIIPKGAKYYVGNKGDVVSTKLIIFETEEDYKNYVENNDEKICIINENSLSLQKI